MRHTRPPSMEARYPAAAGMARPAAPPHLCSLTKRRFPSSGGSMRLVLMSVVGTMSIAAALTADAGRAVSVAAIAPSDNQVAAGRIDHGVLNGVGRQRGLSS